MKKKEKLIFFLKLIFGLGILIFLIYKVGITKVYYTLLTINAGYAVIALFFLSTPIIIGAINLKILLKGLNHSLRFNSLFRCHLMSWSLGLFIPGKMGEFSLMYFLRKRGVPLGSGLVISLVDKLITVVTLLVVAVFGFFIFFSIGVAFKIIILILSLLVIFLFFVISDKGRFLIKKIIPAKYTKLFKGFSKSLFYLFKEKKGVLALNFGLTFLKWIITAFAMQILFFSFGVKVFFVHIFLITAMVKIISLIPITINGLGIKESLAVLLFNIVGVEPVVTIGSYMIGLFFTYSIAFAMLIFATKKG